MTIQRLKTEEILHSIMKHKYSAQDTYLAMYSSWYGGVTTEPALMLVPVDDHIVHRGDGVFEAIKTVHRQVYLLDQHVDRLFASAQGLGIQCPFTKAEVKTIILETLKIANQSGTMIRVFLSRGPGNFSTNPYDSVGAQLFVIITQFKPMAAEKYKIGVKVGISQIPVKSAWLAKIKSCNYLPNVMMKKECVDQNLDFNVSFDEQGFLAESSTENMIWIDSQGVLQHPYLDNILKGTTMTRLLDLVEQKKIMPVQRQAQVTLQQLKKAKAIFMAGTTLDILPVGEFDGQKFSVGADAEKFLALIRQDQMAGSEVTTAY